MGAWGIGVFENDDALDALASCCIVKKSLFGKKKAGFEGVETLLGSAGGPHGFIDASRGAELLVACECVALARGDSGDEVPEEVIAWAGALGGATPPPALVERAAKALEGVCDPERSELRQLWDESGEGDWWIATLERLRARLGG